AGVVTDARKSPLYEPARRMPPGFSKADSSRLTEAIERAVVRSIAPAFSGLLEFVKTEYLPKARADAGIWALPRGEARYRYFVRFYGSTDASPDEIHATAMKGL